MDPDASRGTARDVLPAHSTLLLYTDGLVERRDEALDGALDRLRRHAADLAREPLDTFCDELLIGLGRTARTTSRSSPSGPRRPDTGARSGISFCLGGS